MLNMIKIGEFSKRSGLTPKALRIYEKKLLLVPDHINEKGYRYYKLSSLDRAFEITNYKKLGFTLIEIKNILDFLSQKSFANINSLLSERLRLIENAQIELSDQHKIISNILTSLRKSEEIIDEQRRYVLSKLKQVSIIITGEKAIEGTAQEISQLTGFEVELISENTEALVKQKIYPVNISELNRLGDDLAPDIVVINDVTKDINLFKQNLLKLYSRVGPHMSTVFNADNSESIEVAGEKAIRKGRIFYHSNREELRPQIKNIGGVLAIKNNIELYGFNLKKEQILKLNQDSTFSLNAAMTSLLDIGMEFEDLQKKIR